MLIQQLVVNENNSWILDRVWNSLKMHIKPYTTLSKLHTLSITLSHLKLPVFLSFYHHHIFSGFYHIFRRCQI